MMAQAKRVYILIFKNNKFFFLFFVAVFFVFLWRLKLTLVKLWETPRKLWKHSPEGRVPTTFPVSDICRLQTADCRLQIADCIE